MTLRDAEHLTDAQLREHALGLDSGSREAVASHLSNCTSCQQRFRQAAQPTSQQYSETKSDQNNRGVTASGGLQSGLPNRYRAEKLLGEGGFASVTLAYDTILDRHVAIKVAHSTTEVQQNEYLKEGQRLASLDHPHLVSVYDAGILPDERFYMVTQYIEGTDLASHLRASGQLPVPHAASICRQVAEAIHYVHKSGLWHRDLKPSNILLDKQGQAYVADFGLALHEDEQLGRNDEFAGTPAFMAPEQVRGESSLLDGRVDVWAIGVILYACLTGQRPFRGAESSELLDQILNREPKPLRMIDDRISESLELLCLGALRKPVAERTPTALDIADGLRPFCERNDRREPPVHASNQLPHQASNATTGLIAITIVAIVAIAVVGLLVIRPRINNGVSSKPPETPEHIEGDVEEPSTSNSGRSSGVVLPPTTTPTSRARVKQVWQSFESGDESALWDQLELRDDPTVRSLLIRDTPQWLAPARLFERLQAESRPTVIQALLLALGRYPAAQPEVRSDAIVTWVAGTLVETPDSGVFSACHWLLRTWEHDELLDEKLQELQRRVAFHGPTSNRNWFFAKGGLPMIAIDGKRWDLIGAEVNHRYAISMHAVPLSIHTHHDPNFVPKKYPEGGQAYSPHPLRPAFSVRFFDAAKFCNLLSKAEGIPQTEWCYQPNSDGDYEYGMSIVANWQSQLGYRLPHLTELQVAVAGGTTSKYSFGDDLDLLGDYAWYIGNQDGDFLVKPCGTRMPNALGLFDGHGNNWEWCQNLTKSPRLRSSYARMQIDHFEPRFSIAAGGSHNSKPNEFDTRTSKHAAPNTSTWYMSFRVCRRLPD